MPWGTLGCSIHKHFQHTSQSCPICCLQLDDLQHVQCGQAPLADSSLGQSAPSQAQFSHPSHDVNQSGSRGSGLAAPAAQQLLGANLTSSSSQQRSSGASASQSTPADGHGSGGATTQPTPAAGSGSVQARQQRREAGSGGGGSSAGSRSQPGPQSSVAAGGGAGRGGLPGTCHSDSLLSLQLTRSPVPPPSLQPVPTGQSFPTPQLAQRPPSQLSQVQPIAFPAECFMSNVLSMHAPCMP